MRVDLRSDFLSQPTDAMRRAMFDAASVAPGFGPREDPVVSRLEALAADLLGKEDALFCPTCTLANQIALYVHCPRGRTFIAEPTAHVIVYERSAWAALSGIAPKLVAARDQAPDPEEVAAALKQIRALDPPVSLVWIENTHVYSGGSVVTPAAVDTLHAGIAPAGIPLHLDGSRIFNAAAVIGTDARSLSGKVDTVSISLNKGLAAPLGAILAGPAPFIKEAVRVRQLFGGGWRPATIPAAAGIVALETMIPRLADDHRRARRLGEGLAGRDGIACEPGRVETNIVLADIDRPGLTAARLAARLARHDVHVGVFAERTLRLVTHNGIDDTAIAQALAAFDTVLDHDDPADGGP